MRDHAGYGRDPRSAGPLFDPPEAERRKAEGMKVAADGRAALLARAQRVAVEIGRVRGELTMDDVWAALLMQGLDAGLLGNAAGSVFSGRHWESTGRTVRSLRASTHARRILVWRYVP
jgi:hypothetical protein